MSEDILGELVTKVLNDKSFRENAFKDLEGTLAKHHYLQRLTTEELAAVREFYIQSRGLSQDELNHRLMEGTRAKQGAA